MGNKLSKLNGSSELDAYLVSKGIPFSVSMTRNTKKIEYSGKKIMVSDSHLTKSDLMLFAKVKSDANKYLKNNIKPLVVRSSIRYVSLDALDDGVYMNYTEFDINHAYWKEAFILGIISKETYDLGLSKNFKKSVRLMALGAIATARVAMRFDGENWDNWTEKDTKVLPTKCLFMLIARNVGEKIRTVYNTLNSVEKNACIGHWVDAIFIKKKYAEIAVSMFNDLDFDVKEVKLSWILVNEKDDIKTVYMLEQPKKPVCANFLECDFRIKPFIVPDYKINHYKRRTTKKIIKYLEKIGNLGY